MIKNMWMKPTGALVECSSHNNFASDLISNSDQLKKLYLDNDYPYQVLHKIGWVRVAIDDKREPKVSIFGDGIDLCKPMRNTLTPRMNEAQMEQAKRLCIEYGTTLHQAINDKRFW